jgi:hypothetical protein
MARALIEEVGITYRELEPMPHSPE